MIIELLAWLGALLSCLLSLPQLVHALHSDRLDGVSSTTYWLVLANAAVWGIWALFAEQYAAGVPALVNGPAAVLIITRLHRTRQPQRADDPAQVRSASATTTHGNASRSRIRLDFRVCCRICGT